MTKHVILPEELFNSKIDEQQSKIKKSDIWQFMRFCVVGSLNAIIDFVVLDLFLWMYPTMDTEKILIYNSLAVLLASTNSFFFNKYWTFRQRQPITGQEVARFVVIAGATTVMNDVLILLLSKVFPDLMHSTLIGANVLKLGAIIGTMSISFFGMRLWVFFQRNPGKGLEVQRVLDAQIALSSPVLQEEQSTSDMNSVNANGAGEQMISSIAFPVTPLPLSLSVISPQELNASLRRPRIRPITLQRLG